MTAIAFKSGYTDSAVNSADYWSDSGQSPMSAASAFTSITYSVWDGDWAILEEYDKNGALVEKYLQGHHGLVKTFQTVAYYYQDELGSTSQIAAGTGALIESYRYNLYGKPQVYNASGVYQPNATPQASDLGNGGARWMPELGLYDNRNRFMSPDLGRFLQPDPISFKGDASNLYRYCGNDWGSRVDLLGLQDIPVSREIDVRLWQASMNSLREALNAHDGNGRSQAVQALEGKVQLGSKFGISGKIVDQPREEGLRNHEGSGHHYTKLEGAPLDANAVGIGSGHAHMDNTGKPIKDSPDFSRGPKSDYASAQNGQIISKVNESNPGVVTRLTPQTDGSAPQVREIKAPTKEELKKWQNPYDKPQPNQQQSKQPQASNVEPSGGAGDAWLMVGIVLGGRSGPPTSGPP